MLPKAPKHKRIKPKYSPTPNAAQERYHSHLRAQGCLVCTRPPSIHHVISDGYKRLSKDHWHVTPLCHDHHQGDEGYHALGHDDFTDKYSINLHETAQDLLNKYRAERASND